MKTIVPALAVALLTASLASTTPKAEVRPNCYPADIEVLSTTTMYLNGRLTQKVVYEVLDSEEVYAMYADGFRKSDRFVGLMCDNDTPEDIYDDFFVQVICE